MLVKKDFQTCHLIDCQHSRQPIRSHVRKALLTDMEFNMDLLRDPGPRLGVIKPSLETDSSDEHCLASLHEGPASQNHGPLTRYAKMRVAHAPGTFSLPPTTKETAS